MYKVMDLFCGTGGFSKGFENAGEFEVVHGIDVLPIAVETFKANHPDAFAVADDIRKVRRSEVAEATGLRRGDVDVIIGGPPCQGFSSIRPFRSSADDDPRNSLFEEFASYVNYFRPKALVMENVVGLATYEGGNTIDRILETFSSLGYDCDWRILNAANFGVPQKRERLIILGVERGGSFQFPSFTHASASKTIGYKNKSRMHTYAAPVSTLFDTEDFDPLPSAVTVREAIDDLPIVQSGESSECYSKPPRTDFQRARRENAPDELTLHSSTRHSKKMMEIIRHSGDNISCIPKHLITSGFSSCYSRLRGDEPAVTITVNFVHPSSNKCIHPDLDRALTPREGARLQSFDDDFVFKGNRSQIVKQIGNAVPPLLGQAIARSVLDALGAPTPQ
ncbi:DNA cytosine methyltransferase [Corynebacterium pseudogenitalium]|uniref:Cytosine-specific methyltransferase n=1 Tax=Corynebacterium pseudogenitalium TaxID=38303 RepID=A0ABD4TR30_9CORY|nr:DNA cytosine methyltransferase [Corynebacterium pseudogenitalium]MCQ4614115.1 DNA cytosine methyltransferase [Corynebacterium pseudogenitalium]